MTAVEIRLVPLDASRLHELPAGVVVEDRYGVRWVREDRGDDGATWTALALEDFDPAGVPVHVRQPHYVLEGRGGVLFLVVPVPAGFALRPVVRPLGEDGPATGEWDLPGELVPSAYDARRDALTAAAGQIKLTGMGDLAGRDMPYALPYVRRAAALTCAVAEVYERHLIRPDDEPPVSASDPNEGT